MKTFTFLFATKRTVKIRLENRIKAVAFAFDTDALMVKSENGKVLFSEGKVMDKNWTDDCEIIKV